MRLPAAIYGQAVSYLAGVLLGDGGRGRSCPFLEAMELPSFSFLACDDMIFGALSAPPTDGRPMMGQVPLYPSNEFKIILGGLALVTTLCIPLALPALDRRW